MESYNKNRLLFWLLIVLVVINIAALISYFIFSKKAAAPVYKEQPAMTCAGFCQELDLSPMQTEKVEVINKNYQNNAAIIVTEIKNKRIEILDELNKEKPDTSITNKLAYELSFLQSSLQRENIRQYLELKKVCTPGQAQRLSALYRDLYGCSMQGKGMKYRYRHGRQDSSVCE